MTLHANQLPRAQELVGQLDRLYALRVWLGKPGTDAHLAIMHDQCQMHEPEMVELEEGQADMILMSLVTNIRGELTSMGVRTDNPPDIYRTPVVEDRPEPAAPTLSMDGNDR